MHAFGRSGWVHDRKVTIIVQTRIGFLRGVRRIAPGEGAEEAFHLQLEEAAARATVALTRAREVCVILGPLDMLGPLGAATVVGSLTHGLGICWRQTLEMHYQQDELASTMSDEQMVHQLRFSSGPRADLPPLALVEFVQIEAEVFGVRRLHLVIVDTWRQRWLDRSVLSQLRWKMRTAVAGDLARILLQSGSLVRRGGDSIKCFVYGYALDGSTYACYYFS